MYLILGRGSFCFNYCLNSAWHGGDQFVALLRWYEAQVSLTVDFSSSAFFGLLFLIFLLTILIDSLCSGLVSLLASQAHQHHGHLTNFWCFWQCGQVPTFFHDILIYWDAHVVITWDYYCHSLYVVSAATSQNMESRIACHVSLLRVVRIKTTWKICFLSCRVTFGFSGHLR